ncbi:MAG: hypothetical protein R3C53_26690 [Pirellulaceae bacterium]
MIHHPSVVMRESLVQKYAQHYVLSSTNTPQATASYRVVREQSIQYQSRPILYESDGHQMGNRR